MVVEQNITWEHINKLHYYERRSSLMNTLYLEQTFDDIDMEISFREDSLEIERVMHETACLLDNYDQLSYMEAADDKSGETKSNGLIGGIVKAFQTIIDKIRRVLNSVSEGIKQTFGKQLTVDKYMQSETAQVRFQTDMQLVCKELDAEYNHARKMVRLIASHTPLSEEQVANFIDKTTNMLHKHGPAVLKTSVAIGVGVALNQKVKKMNTLADEAEAAVKGMNTGDGKQVKLAQSVLNGIFSLASTAVNGLVMVGNVTGTYAHNAAKDDKKAQKAAKKKAKKGMK